MNEGKLIVVSGFSGVGKGTVIKKLMDKYPDDYTFSVSATTRAPREGEVNGREYFFISKPLFELMIRDNKLLEYTEYQGNYYGTPLEFTEKMLAAGKSVIFDIEVNGAMNISKTELPKVLIYILPPSVEELAKRLKGRKSETKEQIRGRMEAAVRESSYIPAYDVILVNDKVEETAEELRQLAIAGEQDDDTFNDLLDFAEDLKEELTAYLEAEK
ncbi:MAG: guanylate kinase [Lachnospiraceae bacterium]|nr:guanylate kinase [Lachnospiraceae bacterium]